MSGVTYLHELNIVHGDIKGVRPTSLTVLSPPLTSIAGEYPRR